MKKKLKRFCNDIYLFYIILFCFIFILHLFMKFSNDDVAFFCKQLDLYSFFEYLKIRYNTWTSRVFIEGILICLSRYLFLWRLFDSLVICLLVFSINKLIFMGNKLSNLIFIAGMFLIYPFCHMNTAGFCATTLNYLWPLTFLLFSLGLFRDLFKRKKVNKILLIFYLLAFIYACNQEQAVCIAFVVTFLIFIFNGGNKELKKYSLIMLVIASISLLFIITCPGNDIRNVLETNTWYPNYGNADILDKVYLGGVSTISNLFNYISILWLFSFVLFVLILRNKTSKLSKVIGVLQFLIITIILGIKIYSLITSSEYTMFKYFTGVGDVFQFELKDCLVLGFCIGLILVFCYLLYILLKKDSYCLILVLLMGCGTRLLMGFSPTIFASSTRTMIFLEFSFLIIIIYLWNRYKYLFSKKELMIFYLIIVGCIFNSLELLFSVIL